MYCPSCGKQILEDSAFCMFCGKKLPEKELDISDSKQLKTNKIQTNNMENIHHGVISLALSGLGWIIFIITTVTMRYANIQARMNVAWICYFLFFFSLVFGVMGLKKSNKKYTYTGLILAISFFLLIFIQVIST